MKKLLSVALSLAAAAYAAAPEDATVARLVAARVGARNETPARVTSGAFVAGENDAQALAPLRLSWEYYEEVYAGLFVLDPGGWRLAALEGPFLYMDDFGGDEGTFARRVVGDRTYYIFTCTEASYGTGMGTEDDYFLVYDVAGDALRELFRGETRSQEDWFERWYGGDDSSAYAYGAYSESTTDYQFADVDGDGMFELVALTRDRDEPDGPVTGVGAELYATAEDGNFAPPASLGRFRPALAAADTFASNLLLAAAARDEDGDLAAARRYLTHAAARDASAAAAVAREVETMARLANDPPAAVRLYYRDDVETLFAQYPKTAAAAEAVVSRGDLGQLLAFLKKRRRHPRWLEAYRDAVIDALYTYPEEERAVTTKDLARLKADLGRYLKMTDDAEERARTLTHLADCFFRLGDAKTARRLYERSVAAEPASVFADYNLLRLGDCAAAAGKAGAAIAFYQRCLAADGWWSYQAEDTLLDFAVVADASGRRPFLDYASDAGEDADFASAQGDLDGDGLGDLAVIAFARERRGRLYYFLRRDDDFVGGAVTTGGEVLWLPKVVAAPDGGPALLSCNETVESDTTRRGYRLLYRYDGATMREVSRVKTEERAVGATTASYAATITFAPDAPLAFTLAGTRAPEPDASATPFEEKYVWDEGRFAFARVER